MDVRKDIPVPQGVVAVKVQKRKRGQQLDPILYDITEIEGHKMSGKGSRTLKTTNTVHWKHSDVNTEDILAPFALFQKYFDGLQYGLCIEFLTSTGELKTTPMNHMKRLRREEVTDRFLICLHCSILDFELQNGFLTKQKLMVHITTMHRFQGIPFWKCVTCEVGFQLPEILKHHRDTVEGCSSQTEIDHLIYPKNILTPNSDLVQRWEFKQIEIKYPYTAAIPFLEHNVHTRNYNVWLASVNQYLFKNKTAEPHIWVRNLWISALDTKKPKVQDNKIRRNPMKFNAKTLEYTEIPPESQRPQPKLVPLALEDNLSRQLGFWDKLDHVNEIQEFKVRERQRKRQEMIAAVSNIDDNSEEEEGESAKEDCPSTSKGFVNPLCMPLAVAETSVRCNTKKKTKQLNQPSTKKRKTNGEVGKVRLTNPSSKPIRVNAKATNGKGTLYSAVTLTFSDN